MDLTKIKRLRKEQKLSIKELSKKTGISRERISLIERGEVRPLFENVEKLVLELGYELIIIERV